MIAGSRTLLALALVGVTVAVPSVAWFVAAGREAEREASLAVAAPRLEAGRAARQLAERLGERLERLRAREAARPFYHYQGLYHDPEGASEGAAISRSPLSAGPDDPLVLAHFQVGERGALSLPTLDGVPKTPIEVVARARSVERKLRPVAPRLLAMLPSVAAPLAQAQGQVEVLDRSAYAQNLQASQLYRDIKAKQSNVGLSQAPERLPRGGRVAVETGALGRRTLELDGARWLAALRPVSAPGDRWVQGFVVETAEVARALAVGALPARLVPSDEPVAAADSSRAVAALPGTDWAVVVETAGAEGAARSRAAQIRANFRRTFAAGTAAAALAGLGVVGLVWQSERLARQRSRFAAAAAHELRTPLAGLRLHGEMLAEGLGDPARARGYARTIAAEAERLGRVVGNVLGFTRLERGTLRVDPRAGDLGAVVREGVERHRPALEAAGASVVLAVEDGLPPARFDADAVHQIVHNLLDNAERHTRAASERRVDVAVANAPAGVVVTVRDHGPGIPDGARPRPFRTLDRSGEAASGGLGLGLPLVEALARAQGGALSIARADGGGAHVRVTLPRA